MSRVIILLITIAASLSAERIVYFGLDEQRGESVVSDTITGAIKNAQWVTGKKNGALSFNGIDAHVALLLPREYVSITMAAWVKPVSVPTKLPMSAVGRPGFHQALEYWPNKKFAFSVFDKDNKQYVLYSDEYEPNEWHHLAGTYDEATRTACFYIDGALGGTKTLPTAMRVYPKNFYIGCGNAASKSYAYYFHGIVDEIEVHDSALSTDSIRGLYTATGGSSTVSSSADMSTGIVGHWKFDELVGGVAKDESRFGHDGPISSTSIRVQGKSGGALSFNGSNALVYTKIKPKLTSYTFSAWAKPALHMKHGSICGRPGFHNDIGYNKEKRFYFETFNTANQGFAVSSPNQYEPGEWHHVGGVFDASAKKIALYVDGEKVGEKPFVGDEFRYGDEIMIAAANPASYAYGYWYTGVIDEVIIYSRALTKDDITALYQKHKESIGPAHETHYGFVGKANQPAWFERPIEVVPPVTPALIAQVERMTPVSARIGQLANGLPTLELNGKTAPFMGGDVWDTQPFEYMHLGSYFESGMQIINLMVNCARNTPKLNGSVNPDKLMMPYWIGKQTYDPSSLEKYLWRPLQSNPHAKILFWLRIDTYPEWPDENPDECMMNGNGEYAVGGSHFERYQKAFPKWERNKFDRAVWSFHSKVFRDDVSHMLSNFIRDVNRLLPGKAVMGYLIGGGVDAQLYHWNAPNGLLTKPEFWGDYSPAARNAWQAWLKKRYGTKEMLASAWGVSADGLSLEPPAAGDLQSEKFFHNPLTERRVMDWKRFISDGRYETIAQFAQVIKSASPRPTIVGICSGDSGGRRDLTTMEEFLRDKNIDFFLHQIAYSQRIPPNYGGINAHLASIARNGKMFVADWDFPTYLQKPSTPRTIGAGIHHDSTLQGWAKDMDTLRAMYRRDYAYLWTANAGALWDHVFGEPHAYAAPEIIKEMKFLVDTSRSIRIPSPNSPIADLAVIFDEKSVDFLNMGIARAHWDWVRGQQNELNASGVPYGVYYAADLREGKVPPVKMYLFQNLMNIDEKTASAIERLKKGGATLIFLRDNGYQQALTSTDTLSRIMGIDVKMIADAKAPSCTVNENHPLIMWGNTEDSDDHSIRWPEQCTVFGPFTKNDIPSSTDIALIPDSLTIGGATKQGITAVCKGAPIDLQRVLGGALASERSALVYFEVESTIDQNVYFGAGADWWMQWWVNGEAAFDTLDKGNGKTDYSVKNYQFKVRLKKGKNIALARVLSGTAGFLLAAGGPQEIHAPTRFSAVREKINAEEYTLTVVDPKATILSSYAESPHAGFALKNNASYTTLFVGTRVLSRNLISSIAKQANAWRLTDPEIAVSAACEDIIMIHPLSAGEITIRLKKKASLVECEPGKRTSASALTHTMDLPVGGTYLFMLR
ncbi:MAG: LamG-like jellyroll fold domain-containing protein [Spirochaetota bacterium]